MQNLKCRTAGIGNTLRNSSFVMRYFADRKPGKDFGASGAIKPQLSGIAVKWTYIHFSHEQSGVKSIMQTGP